MEDDMSSRYPSVFGHRGRRHDDEDDDHGDDRRRPPADATTAVPCLIIIPGLQGELRGSARIHADRVVVTAEAGQPSYVLHPSAGTFTTDQDGVGCLTTSAVIVRSKAPDWLAWNRDGTTPPGTRQGWSDDHADDDHHRRRGNSSGLLAIPGFGHGRGLSSLLGRLKGWQIALGAALIGLFALAALAGVALLLWWGAGQLKEHGPAVQKTIKEAVEKSK